VIHCIRHEAVDRTNIKVILTELLERGANASVQDSNGQDAFVHAVTRNHTGTFGFILETTGNSSEESKERDVQSIKKDSVDN
jgi:ankyrin repeat protein